MAAFIPNFQRSAENAEKGQHTQPIKPEDTKHLVPRTFGREILQQSEGRTGGGDLFLANKKNGGGMRNEQISSC